jgi:hypothetical protein
VVSVAIKVKSTPSLLASNSTAQVPAPVRPTTQAFPGVESREAARAGVVSRSNDIPLGTAR